MHKLPLAAILLLAGLIPARAIELGLPVACTIGEDCFVQQFADMDSGPAAADPFCGTAAYDGHDGIDIRVRSMRDMERGVPVIAAADGVVAGSRDEMPDRLLVSPADRETVAGKECGNGVLLQHPDGYETQYCHMRLGSIAVKQGDEVKRGDKLGEIGASGLVEFPHMHLSVRKNGEKIDPMTGRSLSAGCLADAASAAPLFSGEVTKALGHGETGLLAAGLAGNVIDHSALTVEGPPPTATSSSQATIAWAWFTNMRAGDRIGFRLTAPDGSVVVEHVSDPVDRAKADYSGFAGKRGAPMPGSYEIKLSLVRDGAAILEKMLSVTID
ncbi:MAG TPA: M23 family metallopeptidase [Rhizobiaceae bacterium]|nr:M23 family metallopeptidase [Rhizobiaceae bacterium]